MVSAEVHVIKGVIDLFTLPGVCNFCLSETEETAVDHK